GGIRRQVFANSFDCNLGRQFARGLAAHAIRHQEDAALGIEEVAVLIVVAQQAGVGGRAGRKRKLWHAGDHFLTSKASLSASATPISARSGKGTSTSRARRRPLIQVPLRLLSTMVKAPLEA